MCFFKKIEYLINFSFVFFTVFFFTFAVSGRPQPFSLNKTLIKKLKNQGNVLISDRAGSYILRAEGLAEGKKYGKAIELLKYHYEKENLKKSEKAYFAMHLGHLYKQNKDNKKSLFYLQKSLDLKALPYPQHLLALYHIAYIHIGEGKYDKGLKILKKWFSINENPSPQSYVLLAHCYYSQGKTEKALQYIETAIPLVGKPKESWLQFATAIYLKQKNYKKAQLYLEKLTALYPSGSSHWKQLAGVYLYLDKTDLAFVTLDIANKMGYLKSKSEYLNLFSLYIDQGLPYQGARLLKKKINQKLIPKEQKNLEILAEAFWLAREGKTALVYLKSASKTAKDSDFFVKYGQKLLDQEQWSSAEKAFKKALDTEKIKETMQKIKSYKKHLALAKQKENKLNWQKAIQSGYLSKDFNNQKNQPKNELPDSLSQNNSENTNLEGVVELKAPPTNYLENIYLGIGIAFYQQEKYEEALSYFRKSIEVDDTFLSGYQWIDHTESSILEKKNKENLKLNFGSGFSFAN